MIQSFSSIFDIRAVGGIEPYSADEYSIWFVSIVVVSVFATIVMLFAGKKYHKRLIAIPILIAAVCTYLLLDYVDRRGSNPNIFLRVE